MDGGAARLAAGFLAFILGACSFDFGSQPGDGSSPTTLFSALNLDNVPTYYETDANNSLELAESVSVSEGPQAISGSISVGDVDVYDLGPVEPGDRIIVNVTAGAALDGAVALFDDAGAALLVSDHRNVYLGRYGPFIDVIIRRPSPSCFLALSSTPGYDSAGDYVLTAMDEYPKPIPAPREDVILLDFEGGTNVRIGTRSAIAVPAFDAAEISYDYYGASDEMVAQIVAHVREDFAAYDVAILSTSEGAEYNAAMSRVYFGTYDEALLGVAEAVDEYNATSGQEAIVFTNTFAAFMPLEPSVSEMAQAVANVASHEIGHLLGLFHTDNHVDLMDVTASLNELLLDQEFAMSPIYAAVFPLGSQDSVQSLLDAVGGDEALARQKSVGRDRTRLKMSDRTLPPARTSSLFSSCGLHKH